MTTKTIDELSVQLEELVALELAQEPPRIGYAEIAITDNDQPFTVRWFAVNEKQVWRSSESYSALAHAVRAIALLPGGIDWMTSYTPRLVDERTPAPDAQPDITRASATVDDMNPE